MTNPSPQHDPQSPAGETTSGVPNRDAPPATPRWVKIFGIVALVLIVIVVLAMLLGGNHGPGRHGGALPTGGATALISDGVRQT